jgi:hypothetical protein
MVNVFKKFSKIPLLDSLAHFLSPGDENSPQKNNLVCNLLIHNWGAKKECLTKKGL